MSCRRQEIYLCHREVPYKPVSYWQKTAPHFSLSSRLPATADVVIIGGGLLGAATCYWIARTGSSVILLERAGLAAGATGRNGGFISIGPDEAYAQAIARLGHDVAQAILHVTLESRTLLRQFLQEESISCDYREPGHLHLALKKEELHSFAQSSAALQRDGVPTFLLEREQMQEYIHTSLGPQILGGLFVPDVSLVHPATLVQGFLVAAQRYGAQPVAATVQQIQADGKSIQILTEQGSISTGSVVVATNAWIPELLPRLKNVITPVRGQVLAYQPLPPLFTTGMTVDLSGSEEYWQQTLDGTIILGGWRTAAEGNDVDIRIEKPTTVVQDALEQVFPHLFPQLSGLPVSQRWAGLMAFTPDLLPVADQVPGLPHVWVVGGFCGHGMPFGFRFGQLLADAVTKNRKPSALSHFRLDRATLNFTH